MSDQAEIFNTFKKQITENEIVLYMKGDKESPMCGFSNLVVQILKILNVETYLDVNVMPDIKIREGIKDFTNWPTIPQLYIRGEFIGGSDIVREMYESGELEKIINK
jgi:monothiol glutaredoxin